MSAIPAVVKDNVGRPIKLVVKRGDIREVLSTQIVGWTGPSRLPLEQDGELNPY